MKERDIKSKKLIRTNIHISEFQLEYFRLKNVNLAKLVRKLLNDEIFKDMGRNPYIKLDEAKREIEAFEFANSEQKKHEEEMRNKFESIQTTITRMMEGYCREPTLFPYEARKRITKEWEIPWEDFKECAETYCNTGRSNIDKIIQNTDLEVK